MATRLRHPRVKPHGAHGAVQEPWIPPLGYLLALVPLAIAAQAVGQPLAAFPLAVLALIGGAFLIGHGAEVVASKLGDGIGSLVTATLSNVVTLAVLGAALAEGLQDVVRGSITGAILADILLCVGGGMFLGGLNRPKQTFGREAAAVNSTLLLVASFALVTPGLVHKILGAQAPNIAVNLTVPIAAILLATYVAGLLFATRTHKHLFNPEAGVAELHAPRLVRQYPIPVLVVSIALVGVAAEVLSNAITPVGERLGLHPFFLGVVVLGAGTSVVEIATTWKLARQDRMNVGLQVAIGSGIQVMLFVTPLLVFASLFLGSGGFLSLDFPLTMTIAIGMAAVLVNVVSSDGESTWYEGALLLSLFAILAMVFYFHP